MGFTASTRNLSNNSLHNDLKSKSIIQLSHYKLSPYVEFQHFYFKKNTNIILILSNTVFSLFYFEQLYE